MIFQVVTAELSVARCDRCHSEVRRWRGETEVECNACGATYDENGHPLPVVPRETRT